MMPVRRKTQFEMPPAPTEHEGKPIVARILVDDEDIAYVSSTKVSLSLKRSFFDTYEKDAYVDLAFIGEQHSDGNIYRYKLTSQTLETINLKLTCVI